MENTVKKEFVRRVLQDESQRFLKNQTHAIQSRLQSHTGRLLAERQIEIISDQDKGGKFELSHPVYERFLDLKSTYNRNSTFKLNKSGTKLIRKFAPGYVKKKTPRIHNSFVFGHYYSIAGRLMTEFTEETAAAIRKELGETTTINIDL